MVRSGEASQAEGFGDSTAVLVRIQSFINQHLNESRFDRVMLFECRFLRDITDANLPPQRPGTAIRLRALVSATDAPRLWDLRCEVREHLVAWVRDHHPGALPHAREEITNATPVFADPESVAAISHRRHEDQRVFSDSPDGRARGGQFVGPQGGQPDSADK